LNKQPAVRDADVELPIGDRIAEQVISLPMHPYLGISDQEVIVNSLAPHMK
jgi:UDP-2-acetamido-2-deoxy-ribo-hexuluronate aminotransferase